ncbi:ClpP/crotonase-like domain-containing protein [Xylogone sp. PMI_703]|nr:ClpP/crotonase-like domain-containing protein [Xylogone sp. PMI_703]
MLPKSTEVQIPETYTTAPDSHVRITNYPESATQVTPIIVVTLNRPDRFNALTMDMINTLQHFFEVVTFDSRIKCVVLTGAGKAFCSGIDLNVDATFASKLPVGEIRDIGGTLALAIYNCTKTVIVGYNGLAVGMGMTSTLAAGIRIASAKSQFGFPFSRIGLNMESASSFFLPRMVGYSKATYLLSTGKRYPGDHRLLDGIFAEILDKPEDVLPRALEIAKEISEEVSTMAVHLNRQLIWRNRGSAEEAHLDDSPVLADLFAGRDHHEAKRAFFEKDKPKFVDELEKNAPRTYPWWKEVSVQTNPKPVYVKNSKL